MTDILLTRAEAAARARICIRTLETLINNGTGPAVLRIGRRVLISEAGFQAWLTRCASGGAA